MSTLNELQRNEKWHMRMRLKKYILTSFMPSYTHAFCFTWRHPSLKIHFWTFDLTKGGLLCLSLWMKQTESHSKLIYPPQHVRGCSVEAQLSSGPQTSPRSAAALCWFRSREVRHKHEHLLKWRWWSTAPPNQALMLSTSLLDCARPSGPATATPSDSSNAPARQAGGEKFLQVLQWKC